MYRHLMPLLSIQAELIGMKALDSVYLKFRRLARYSEDFVKQQNKLDMNKECLACEVITRDMQIS